MNHLAALLIVALLTYVAWAERARITAALTDEWTAFLDELQVIA